MKYLATFTGREKNAIGLFYQITASVEANNPEEANLRLYYKYDHITQLTLASIPDNGNYLVERYTYKDRYTDTWFNECYHVKCTDTKTTKEETLIVKTLKEARSVSDKFLNNN